MNNNFSNLSYSGIRDHLPQDKFALGFLHASTFGFLWLYLSFISLFRNLSSVALKKSGIHFDVHYFGEFYMEHIYISNNY